MSLLTLNRNPDNFFAETEQVAFHVGNLVPGIDVTDDPRLQGRLFSYLDTQLTRLGGPNFHEIPINRPVCPFHNLQRDGFHRQTISKGRISQATLFWESQTATEQLHIVQALQFELGKVTVPAVRQRMLSNLVNVDASLAARVATALGMAVPPASPRNGGRSYPKSKALSMIARGNPTLAVGRKVAFLAADGVDAGSLQAVKTALERAGVSVRVLSSHLGELRSGAGSVKVDDLIVTMPSVVFDAVVVPGGAASVATLKVNGDALHFVREAYKHAKAIGALGEGTDLLTAAGLLTAGADKPAGVLTAGASAASEFAMTFIAAIGAHRHWARANLDAVAA